MTSTTDEIRELGAAWVDAELAADVDTLDALATDDFHLVGPFGFVLDKQQWLDRYRAGDFTTTALTWLDVEVRQYGESVVTIGTQSQQAAYGGRRQTEISGSHTCSYAMTDGRSRGCS